MQKLKKTGAVLALLIFLFPLVETALHNYAHRNDFRCTSISKHIHKADHHCNICDFTISPSDSPSFRDYHFRLDKPTIIHFFLADNHYLQQQRDFQSLRGPPALV